MTTLGDDDEPREDTPAADGDRADERTRVQQAGVAASRLGGAIGRLTMRATAQAKPQATRGVRAAAEGTRAAAQAARPYVVRVASQARDYARDHEDEFKRAAGVAAGIAASRVIPLPLRPMVVAVAHEFRRGPDGRRDERVIDVDVVEDPEGPSRDPGTAAP